MANIDNFEQGAGILQQVDVSDIFTSLAMGIAEAQQKLDDNSVAQLVKLSEQEIAGKSLLELGFLPAFYNFTYADISTSINLKMALKTSFALDIALSAAYDSNKQGTNDIRNTEKEKDFNSEKKEFKSSRKFTIKSDSKKAVVINGNHYKLDENQTILSRIEKFHSQVIDAQNIERLNYLIRKPVITRYTPKITFTILKICNLSGTGNEVYKDKETNPEVKLVIANRSFSEIFAESGGKYGFSVNQFYGLNTTPQVIELHFGFDKRIINFNYKEDSVNNESKEEAFDALAAILREDTDTTITIEGYTDSSGRVGYNDILSKDRCNAMKDWLVAKGADKTKIQISPKGKSLALANSGPDNTRNVIFRKVVIKFTSNCHYIYFNEILSDSSPQNRADDNYFIVASNSSTEIKSGELESNVEYLEEIRSDIKFFLAKDTQIEFSAYSNSTEEINIRSEEEEGEENEIVVAQNESTKERLKNIGSENSSNRTVALSASVDLRMSKQFEMSMEGNSSMSARMVATPPPPAFLDHINRTLTEE